MRTIPTTKYDRKIEIWKEVKTGSNALNEPIFTPVKVCNAWASVSNRAALERLGIASREALKTEVFTIRYCSAHAQIAAKTHFIRYQGRDYNVSPPIEVGYREAFDVKGEARSDDAAV